MAKKASAAFVAFLIVAIPAFAGVDLPGLVKGFEDSLGELVAPLQSIAKGRYAADDHAKAAAALTASLDKARALREALPEIDRQQPSPYQALKAALQDSAKNEAALWQAAQKQAPFDPASAKPLVASLGGVSDAFKKLFTGLDPALQKALAARLDGGDAALAKVGRDVDARMASLSTALKAGPSAAAADLNKFFGGGNGFVEGTPDNDVVVAGAGGTGRRDAPITTTPAKPKGLVTGDVPLEGDAENTPDPGGVALNSAQLEHRKALLAALVPFWPVGDAAQAGFNAAQRQQLQLRSAQAEKAWLEQHRDLVKKPDVVLASFDRGLSADQSPERRRAALAAAQLETQEALDRSATAKTERDVLGKIKDLQSRAAKLAEKFKGNPGSPEFQAQLAPLLESLRAEGARFEKLREDDPLYFQARAALTEYVAFNRAHLNEFPEGTRFSPQELGLAPGQPANVIAKVTIGGSLGFEYTGPDKLKHWASLDGKRTRVTAQDGGVVERTNNEKGFVVTTFDAKKHKLDAVAFENLEGGRVLTFSEKRPWPKTAGRFGERGFVAEEIRNEDGSKLVSAGDAAPGVWSIFGADGKLQAYSLGAKSVTEQKDLGRRAGDLAKIASWVVAKGGASGVDAGYKADSIAAMLQDYLRHRPGVEAQILFTPDGQVVINESKPGGGIYQTIGKFEDSQMKGWPDGVHQKAMVLQLYVRDVAKADDPDMSKFTRIFGYLGSWGSESASTKVQSNTDGWFWWVAGAHVDEIKTIHRSLRTGGLGDDPKWQEQGSVELDAVAVFDSPGIVGATGQAVATLGKGVVDVTAAGIAAGLAYSPAMMAASALSDDAKGMQDDLLNRARTDFLGNAVNRQFYGADTLKSVGVDDRVYVQNVGQEMTDLGHPTAGAFLQGGINFSNNVAPLMLNIGILSKVGQLGNIGKLTTVAVGGYMSWQGGYALGTSINDFGNAVSNYDPKNPESQRQYYAALTSLTEQGLNMPLLFGGLKEVYEARAGKAKATTSGAAPVVEEGSTSPRAKPGLVGKVKAFDAAIPDFLGKLPGGEWMNREFLGIKPPPKSEEPVAGGKPPVVEGQPEPAAVEPGDALQKKLASDLAAAEAAAKLDPSKIPDLERARAAMAQSQYVLNTDLMTGTPNRGFMDRNAPQILEAVRAKGGKPTVAIGDLNNFGATNDGFIAQEGSVTKGTELADTALGKAGVRLNGLARQFDVTIARYGGEEFVIVGDEANVHKFIEASKAEFADRRILKDAGVTGDHMNAVDTAAKNKGRGGQSVGDFTWGVTPAIEGADFGASVKAADAALNWAKQNGARGEGVTNLGDGRFKTVDPAMTAKEKIQNALARGARDTQASKPALPIPQQIEILRASMSPADFNAFMKVAFQDNLTGLRTRDYIAAKTPEWTSKYADGGEASMLSLRALKPINDALGHEAGDRVLERVGEIAQEVAKTKQHTGVGLEDPIRLASKDFVALGDGSAEFAAEVQRRFEAELKEGKILTPQDRARMDAWAETEIAKKIKAEQDAGKTLTEAQKAAIAAEVRGEVASAGTIRLVNGKIAPADIGKTLDGLIEDMAKRKTADQQAGRDAPDEPTEPEPRPTPQAKTTPKGDPAFERHLRDEFGFTSTQFLQQGVKPAKIQAMLEDYLRSKGVAPDSDAGKTVLSRYGFAEAPKNTAGPSAPGGASPFPSGPPPATSRGTAGRPAGSVLVRSGGKEQLISVTLDRAPGMSEATFLGADGGGQGVAVKTAQYVGIEGRAEADARAFLQAEAQALARARELTSGQGFPDNVSVPEVIGLGYMDPGLASKIYGEPRNVPTLLMKRARGVTLEEWFNGGRSINTRDFQGLADGIKALQKSGLAHGDIHTGNILIWENPATGRQMYTLLDFGAAKVKSAGNAEAWSDVAKDDLGQVREIYNQFKAKNQVSLGKPGGGR